MSKKNREIIIHCFQWNLKDITSQLHTIKENGYTAIQITPIQTCKNGQEWWNFYQPLGLQIGNKTGSKEDLKELCGKANDLGLKIIVDVVLRHVGGTNDGKLVPHEDVDPVILSNPNFFTNTENSTNYEDRWEATHMAFGMPMLNYDNEELQDLYIQFLEELKACGVGGFRIDMGKHFSLPEEGSVFWTKVFGRFGDMFNYAECIDCSVELLDKYINTTGMNILTDCTATDKSKLVIFIMSHDTEETWGITKKMDDNTIIKEWNYLLSQYKDSHVLFYCREYSDLWKSEPIKWVNINNQ